jgi:hypothetical protein
LGHPPSTAPESDEKQKTKQPRKKEQTRKNLDQKKRRITNQQNPQSKKQWRVPRDSKNAPRAIMPGDSGIFATCNKGREARCVGELRDLFSEYASQLYGDAADEDDDNDNDGGATSIENDIQAELAGIQKPVTAQLFVPVKLDVQCGEFLKENEEDEDEDDLEGFRFLPLISPSTALASAFAYPSKSRPEKPD